MKHLIAVLHVWGLDLERQTSAAVDRLTRPRGSSAGGDNGIRDEQGSVTIENVLWAVAVIAIVAIVVVAIKGYVRTQAGKIK